jgi:hypothetical protein
MPGEPSLKPAEAPEPAPKGRLEQALDLINDEAVETLQKGRNARGYQRTEKLLAIARALKLECATSVEDFLEQGVGDGEQKMRAPNYQGGVVLGNNDFVFNGGAVPMNAGGDMQREEKLAQLEAVAARRRRDEAEARLTMVREFKELSDLDLGKLPQGTADGLRTRLAELSEAIQSAPTKAEVEEPEAESA